MNDAPTTIDPSPGLLERARVAALRAVRTGGFVGATATMLPAFLAHDRFTPEASKVAVRDAWVGAWSRVLLSLFSIHVETIGAPPPRHHAGRLVVANHRSTIDIAVLLQSFGGHMVSRGDLAHWPLLGIAARKVGTVFVDRQSAIRGANTIREMRGLLKARQTVNVFPEGTTFEGDEVRPFHAGAFVAALRSGAQIVPVGIAYEKGSGAAFVGESFGKHLARMAGARPTRVVVSIGEAFPVPNAVRTDDLRARAHEAVTREVARARARCDA